MPSISELKRKIKGIKSTRQITNAMKMVAGARLGRAQREMNESLYFPREFERVIAKFLRNVDLQTNEMPYILDPKRTEDPACGVVFIAADKGLCGEFNSSLIKNVNAFSVKNSSRIAHVWAVGVKIADHLPKLSNCKVDPHTHLFNTLQFKHADKIGDSIIQALNNGEITDLHFLYNRHVSAMKYEFTNHRVLPIDLADVSSGSSKQCDIEPEESGMIVNEMVALWVKSKLYAALRSSYSAELSARMRAMDNATRNAGTLIDEMTLEMNKVRQSVITREIIEITGTSEVMKE